MLTSSSTVTTVITSGKKSSKSIQMLVHNPDFVLQLLTGRYGDGHISTAAKPCLCRAGAYSVGSTSWRYVVCAYNLPTIERCRSGGALLVLLAASMMCDIGRPCRIALYIGTSYEVAQYVALHVYRCAAVKLCVLCL